MKKNEGLCEMCGYYVAMKQKAHIVAEKNKSKANILMICPSCHVIFDTQLKPKLYNALEKAGVRNIPKT
jgi:hypothetical protein